MKKDNLLEKFQNESIVIENVSNIFGGQITWESDFGETTYDSDCHCMINDCRTDSAEKKSSSPSS